MYIVVWPWRESYPWLREGGYFYPVKVVKIKIKIKK
jgi:hypothetical protein